jgi:hypothetical protein
LDSRYLIDLETQISAPVFDSLDLVYDFYLQSLYVCAVEFLYKIKVKTTLDLL